MRKSNSKIKIQKKLFLIESRASPEMKEGKREK